MGPVASKVLFENDRVKIWNLIVEPHTHQNWHHHPRDYVTICVAHGEDAIGVEYESGETGPFPSKVGTWWYHGDGQAGPSGHRIHRVVNNTDKRYTNVLVELKD